MASARVAAQISTRAAPACLSACAAARAVRSEPLTSKEMHQVSLAVQAAHPDMLLGALNAAAQQAIAAVVASSPLAAFLVERCSGGPVPQRRLVRFGIGSS